MRLALLAPLFSLVCLAACGDDELSYSAPVGIKLSVSSGDVANGEVLDEKNINTESGNPYGAFIAEARDELGGGDPGAIRLDRLQLQLDSTSNNVTTLAGVFGGVTDIEFIMSGTDTVVPVASFDVVAATGAGPVEMTIGFDSATVTGADWTSLIGGQFKVVVAGPAASTFAAANADADLTATFEFTALE
jgi:hypothetical protein